MSAKIGVSMNHDICRKLADLADTLTVCLRRLAQDTGHPSLRVSAGDALDALMREIEQIVLKVDLFLSPLPHCPADHLLGWAIRGGRTVTSEECRNVAVKLDMWANEIDRLGGVTE